MLLEEGFKVERGRAPKNKAKRQAWEEQTIEAMRRKVWNDREWWRKHWKRRAAGARPTAADLHVAREEHIASLESDLEDIHGLIEDGGTKATARAMLIGERRQTRALLAKTRGVDELLPPDPDSDKPQTAVVGMILGLGSVTPEMRTLLRGQGVAIAGEEDEAGTE